MDLTIEYDSGTFFADYEGYPEREGDGYRVVGESGWAYMLFNPNWVDKGWGHEGNNHRDVMKSSCGHWSVSTNNFKKYFTPIENDDTELSDWI
jgi:hypothetical protein